MSKHELALLGRRLVEKFCEVNSFPVPEFRSMDRDECRQYGGTCAYYRPSYIKVCIEACAAPGTAGRAWSWPGYVIDRTPYGVYAHELGHHVDVQLSDVKGRYSGDFSRQMRARSMEPQLTGYCDNDGEWFAEMFRLFCTNPDLLRLVRPVTYGLMTDHLTPVVKRDWRGSMLGPVPERTVQMARKKFFEK